MNKSTTHVPDYVGHTCQVGFTELGMPGLEGLVPYE